MDTHYVNSLAGLTEAEARALLESQEVGRLVYTRRALPAVTPVNYAVRDDAIWIWTASASSMAQAVRGAVVAFEVDDLDRAMRTGWSVLVLGVAELIVAAVELERALVLGPEPWVQGRKEHLIRIPIKVISGRRLESPRRSAGYGEGVELAPGMPPHLAKAAG